MKVDINTKFIGLLGKPLKQSFAARMQNAAYRAAGLNVVYFYNEVENDHLGDVVNGIRYMPFAGFAVTKPNKVAVLQYLDGLDPLCEKMGASNTVVKTEEGKLIGYNTDGVGFYQSLMEEGGLKAKDHTFLLLGAGGAGRAMCSVLAYEGAKKIYIASRTLASAEALASDLNENFAPVAEAMPMANYKDVLAKCDCVMNSSGVGMGKSIGQNPMKKEDVDTNALYYDACYNPAKTQFLLDAEEMGAKILNGLGMSLYQGAAQIKLWSGVDAPVEVMRQELFDILEGKAEKE